MGAQIKLDFSGPRFLAEDEKKTELISFRTGSKFKEDLFTLARSKNVDLAVLIHEYAIKGYLEDYKNLLLAKVYENRTVKELLKQA